MAHLEEEETEILHPPSRDSPESQARRPKRTLFPPLEGGPATHPQTQQLHPPVLLRVPVTLGGRGDCHSPSGEENRELRECSPWPELTQQRRETRPVPHQARLYNHAGQPLSGVIPRLPGPVVHGWHVASSPRRQEPPEPVPAAASPALRPGWGQRQARGPSPPSCLFEEAAAERGHACTGASVCPLPPPRATCGPGHVARTLHHWLSAPYRAARALGKSTGSRGGGRAQVSWCRR